MSGEMDFPSDQDGEAVQAANTPDSWRNTTTQERETIVGDKLHEVKMNWLVCEGRNSP